MMGASGGEATAPRTGTNRRPGSGKDTHAVPDTMTWISSLLSTLAVSCVSLIGLTALQLDPPLLRRVTAPLVGLGVGTLLGDAFIHLVPQALECAAAPLAPSLWLLAGVLLFFTLDRLMRRRTEAQAGAPSAHAELIAVNLVADGVHNFIDGVLIAAGYLVSPSIGLSTTVAVICHEVPQELADFAILVHAGLDARRAIAVNLASASTALLGTLCTLAIGTAAGPVLTGALIPITAGGFVYIAGAQLMPELQRDERPGALVLQLALMALGIGLMTLLTLLE